MTTTTSNPTRAAPDRDRRTGYLGATHAACMAELASRCSAWTSTRTRSPRCRPAGCRSTSPASTSSSPSRWPQAGCGSPRPSRRWRRSATCTSSASAPRRSGASSPPTCATSTPPRRARPAPAAAVPGRGEVDRAGRHRGPPRRAPRRARARGRRRRAGLEPGVPAGGLRRRRHAAPGPAGLRRRVRRAPRRCCGTVYAPLLDAGVPMIVTDYQTAELVKVSANAFLATKISFINAMAEVCETRDADVTAARPGAALDPRIGGRFLHAGLGFGGGCLPKDIRAFMARAGELGADQALSFLREVDAINMRRRARMIDLAREQCDGSVLGKRDRGARRRVQARLRRHPRLARAERRRARSSSRARRSTVYDPKANDNARKMYPTLAYADSAVEAADRARRRAAPDRVARVRATGPGGAGPDRRRPARSSTAATRSTRRGGAARAGPTGRSGRP